MQRACRARFARSLRTERPEKGAAMRIVHQLVSHPTRNDASLLQRPSCRVRTSLLLAAVREPQSDLSSRSVLKPIEPF